MYYLVRSTLIPIPSRTERLGLRISFGLTRKISPRYK